MAITCEWRTAGDLINRVLNKSLNRSMYHGEPFSLGQLDFVAGPGTCKLTCDIRGCGSSSVSYPPASDLSVLRPWWRSFCRPGIKGSGITHPIYQGVIRVQMSGTFPLIWSASPSTVICNPSASINTSLGIPTPALGVSKPPSLTRNPWRSNFNDNAGIG